jgi:hypothetical protein
LAKASLCFEESLDLSDNQTLKYIIIYLKTWNKFVLLLVAPGFASAATGLCKGHFWALDSESAYCSD